MSTTYKWIVAILVIIFIVAGVWYYGAKPSAPVETGPIKIGVILPLTGTSADNGINVKNGLLLAQKEINDSGKIKIDFIFEDSQYKSEEAVKAIEKLVNIDQVKYIIGDYGSSQTLAIAPIAEKNKVILITPGTQSNTLSNSGDYIFRVHPSIRDEVGYFLPKIAQISQKTKLGMIALNTDMGKDYSSDFKDIYPTFGGEVGPIMVYEVKETDFRTMLLKLKNAGINDILFVGNRKMSGMVMKQIVEQKMSFKVYMAAVAKGDEFLSVAGIAGEGIILPSNKLPKSEAVTKFETSFEQINGKKPGFYSIVGYDALKILSFCLVKSGDKVEGVKTCLYGIKGEEAGTLRNDLAFDKNGDLKSPQFELETVKNGQFVPYE